MTGPSDPRAEAHARLGGRYEVRVLEPSPPAVTTPPNFADDPTAIGGAVSERPIVSPVSGTGLLWADLAADDAQLADFCADRWLAAYRRLEPLPPAFDRTVAGLHRLAREVVAPTRARALGHQSGLRWVRGGFGTPFFGNDAQIRVQGDILTVEADGRSQEGRITTLADAAEFLGFDLTRFESGVDHADLGVDRAAGLALGDWLGFATSVLEELRARHRGSPSADPSRVQLWPERFELTMDLGPAGRRVTLGAGCGGEDHEPCLFASDWLGGEPGHRRAALTYSELLGATDQPETALEFLESAVAPD